MAILKPTHKRYHILVLIFGTVVINYLDRANISVAMSDISESFNFNSVQMGWVFAGFAWTYALLQIPGGMLADRVRSRILYAIMMLFWSVATLFQSFANSLLVFIGLRASIGMFEAPSYPTNNAIVTRWFPVNERASAIAMYTSGQFVGLAVLTPVLVAIQTWLGWRGLFLVSGGVGVVWAVVWYLFYRDPLDHPKVNEAELNYIRRGGGILVRAEKKERASFTKADFKKAFGYRKLWGIYMGQYCIGTMLAFFLTWFVPYLVKYRDLDFMQSGFLAAIPYLSAFLGIIFSGFASDFLLRKGYSAELARKAPILLGMLLSVTIIGANYAHSTTFIIVFMALAFFGNGLASIAWIFVSALAPKHLIGLVGGVFNFMGGVSGIVTPIVIGVLVKDGNFAPALFMVGAIALLGFFSYLFVVGKVERVDGAD